MYGPQAIVLNDSIGNANTERLLIRQEKCAQYWPSDGSVVHGDISIEIKREEENESYTVRDLLVTNNRVRSDHIQRLCRHGRFPGSLENTSGTL